MDVCSVAVAYQLDVHNNYQLGPVAFIAVRLVHSINCLGITLQIS